MSGVTAYFTIPRGGPGLDVQAQTDRDGRFRAALVPGQKYAFGLWTSRRLLRNVGEVEVESGRIKILDFGLARFVSEAVLPPDHAAVSPPDEPAPEGATALAGGGEAYAAIGTADYLAPEEILDARRADIRADTRDVNKDRADLRADRKDISSERADIRADTRDVNKDRADLRADRKDISSDRADNRADTRDVIKDRADVRADQKDIARDRVGGQAALPQGQDFLLIALLIGAQPGPPGLFRGCGHSLSSRLGVSEVAPSP